MKTSRQILQDFVSSHGSTTVAEISQALKMTTANARHHLAILEKAGQVQVIGRRPSQGRGRPALIYGPSQQALGHNLDLLAGALLDEIQAKTDEDQNPFLTRLAKKLATPYRLWQSAATLQIDRKAHLTERLYHAVSRLNQLKYQARWEAHHQSPQVIFSHCPYHSIIDRHPELCQMDAYLLEALIGQPVSQDAKLVKDHSGRSHCAFRIRQ